jgi:hypothetical protein
VVQGWPDRALCQPLIKGDLSGRLCFDTGAGRKIITASFAATNCGLRCSTAQGEEIMTAQDMDKAEATYGGFIATLKWTVPLIAVIAFVVVALIAE